MEKGQIKLISGSSNPELAQEISKYLKIGLTPVKISKFADGETYLKILESVRGQDVFIIQSTCNPGNENIIELLIMIDALKRASAGRITAVMPFFGYARQDRKGTSREPITAKLVANLITTAGADRILVVDLHAPQVQGFFDKPLDHIQALPLIANYFEKMKIKDLIIVSPDIGGIKLNRELAVRLQAPLVIIYKRRSLTKEDTLEQMTILGEVKGKNIIMADDEINTGGTICTAVNLLKKAGAKEIYLACTHPIFAGKAPEILDNAPIKKLIVTNTIPIPKEKQIKKVEIISLAPVISESIKIINEGRPMGTFLDNL